MRLYICDKQNVDIDAAYEHITPKVRAFMRVIKRGLFLRDRSDISADRGNVLAVALSLAFIA